MSYELETSEHLDRIFAKLSKKDKLQFEILTRKIKEIEPKLIKISKETGEEYYNTIILQQLIYPLKIKKMNFDKYSNGDKSERIERAMQKRTQISIRGRTSYDISFEYDPEKNMAWYSEEYRDCGNGHYYLALNNKYAVFWEDD